MFPQLHEPFFLPKKLRRGIDSAFGKGIAPQNSPTAEKYPHENAVIVDTAFRVFRARGGIETGVVREMLLIKADKPYAESLQVRLKNLPPQKLIILRQQFSDVDLQSIVPF